MITISNSVKGADREIAKVRLASIKGTDYEKLAQRVPQGFILCMKDEFNAWSRTIKIDRDRSLMTKNGVVVEVL